MKPINWEKKFKISQEESLMTYEQWMDRKKNQPRMYLYHLPHGLKYNLKERAYQSNRSLEGLVIEILTKWVEKNPIEGK